MIRGSLQRRLLWVVLIAAIPAFIAHIAFQIYLDQDTASIHTATDTQDVAAAAMPLLKSMLIIGDLAAVQETLDEVMSHGQFRTLRILDSNARDVLSDGRSLSAAKVEKAPAWFVDLLDVRFQEQRFPIDAGGSTYGILVAEPSSLFLIDDLWERLWAAAAIWLITLMVFFALLRATLRRSLKPLEELADTARHLGEGNLDCRAPVSDVPELAQTAKAFNQMAEQLSDAKNILEEKVWQATIELQSLIVRIPVGVFKLRMRQDGSMRFDYVSPRWCEILDLRDDEVYADPTIVLACIHPDEREAFDQLQVGANRSLTRFEWEGRLCEGKRIRWLHMESEPTQLDNGDVLWQGIQYDITANKEREFELDRIAHYDALTGIPNRILFADRLQQALALAKRTGTSIAVCYLDLDGFKPVNDRHGHNAGDTLLVEIARRLHVSVRSVDTVARIGGDEFVMLLVDITGTEECAVTLDRVLSSIQEPVSIGPSNVSVSASIGVAIYPQDAVESDLLLRLADQAMYSAKQQGRSKCVFSSNVKDGIS
jgi:diguanylate cyclase (GGDEF)-like protein